MNANEEFGWAEMKGKWRRLGIAQASQRHDLSPGHNAVSPLLRRSHEAKDR